VHPPALDPAAPDRDAVRVDDRLLPEGLVEVDDLEQRAAMVDVRLEPRRPHALDPPGRGLVSRSRRADVHQPPVPEKC